jgi:uncharacterized protein
MTRDGRIQLTIVFAVLAVAVGWPSVAAFYTDWLWFVEVGYTQVFNISLTTKAGLGTSAALLAFVWLVLNFRFALRVFADPYLVLGVSPADGRPLVVQRKGVIWLATVVPAVVAIALAAIISSHWMEWLQFLHATPFGTKDPIFGHDVSFYVFTAPWLNTVRDTAMIAVVLSLVGSAIIYMLPGRDAGPPRMGPFASAGAARQHLSVLSAIVLLLLAAGAYLDKVSLAVSPEGIIQGATYADVTIRRPALDVLMGVSLVGALMAIVHAFVRRSWLLVGAFALYVATWFGGEVAATAVQRLLVTPNEQVKETPYIAYNIQATRRAFGIDDVDERSLSGDATLTKAAIEANAATIENIRLWDQQPLLDTFGQIQEIRTYYDFTSVDNDRYVIGGKYRQVMLSARELNSESLPSKSWINERLTFTHGYGVTLGPVNEVAPEGLPVLFLKNIPPESDRGIEVKEPSIYYGELSNDHVFVGTRAREFHYPKGDDNVYQAYAGQGGVPVGSMLRKLMFASRFRSFKVVLSEDLTPESRVLYHRNIVDRVTTIAPFLSFDRDPYLVIADGRLYWMLDAYTWTSHYPYSTRTAGGLNYIRNSVKVVIDAYHGTTTFYLADTKDPMAATLGKIFPGLFTPYARMPESLRRHVRYPEDIFGIQSSMYATYHMTNPAVFYNKEDQWEVPTIDVAGAARPLDPYYTIMRLPGESSAEFIQMLPFTPRRKDNLAAWMVARSDGAHYGRMFVFQFPKQKVVFGPRQIVARINQDQVISPQITLWNQQGSEVIQGTLLVIPIEESLLYVRPLYLKAAGGKIPELKRVIVAYQNQIAMENSLEEAINTIFARKSVLTFEDAPPEPAAVVAGTTGSESLETLATLARQHFEAATKAQRDGDWAVYGEELKKLSAILDQMTQKQAPKQ